MAATINLVSGYNFGSTELVTSTKLNAIVGSASATISGIIYSEISSVSVQTFADSVFWENDLVGYNNDFVYYR